MDDLASKLHPVFLGFNALELWDSLNLVMISYALMVFAPRWSQTANLTLVIPFFHSMVYVSGLVNLMSISEEQADFTTFQGVVKLFQDPNGVFVGWVHYIVFDCLVARMILLDSIQRGASTVVHFLVVVPCMFTTLMVGPTGFMIYMMLRIVVLPVEESKKLEYEKVKVL